MSITDVPGHTGEAAVSGCDAGRVAVLVPCYNEALSIAKVVRDFRAALPSATIYVYDNNSSDATIEVAREAGAVVRREPEQGKGNVVRRMFADVDADHYIMVDGDATYDAQSAARLLSVLASGQYDMVNVARKHVEQEAYRPGHVFGNRMLTDLVGFFFGTKTSDMLSGYKAFSRRFVKTFPASSKKFEIETELMIHCLDLRLPMAEIEAPYGKREEGSFSKLNTVRDGVRIVRMLGWLLKHEKPLLFFSILSALLALLSLAIGTPVLVDYVETGLVPKLPSALLAAAIMLTAVIGFFSGLILDTVSHSRRETKRLFYLLQSR